MSQDPGKNGGNWFMYCNANPVNNVDQTGKDSNSLLILLIGGLLLITGGILIDGGIYYAIGVACAALGFVLIVIDAVMTYIEMKNYINKIIAPANQKQNQSGEAELSSSLTGVIAAIAVHNMVLEILIDSIDDD